MCDWMGYIPGLESSVFSATWREELRLLIPFFLFQDTPTNELIIRPFKRSLVNNDYNNDSTLPIIIIDKLLVDCWTSIKHWVHGTRSETMTADKHVKHNLLNS